MDKKIKTKTKIILDAVSGVLMLLCVIAYLLIGFIAGIWHPTWVILVVGAIVSWIINIVADTVQNIKEAKQELTEQPIAQEDSKNKE